MPTIKVASFNIEFMNDWFTPDAQTPAFRPTFVRDGFMNDTQQTAGRAAALIRAMDADIVALQEAASRAAEVALFIQDFLSDNGTPRYSFFLGDSGGGQKLALLWKPGSVDSAQLAAHPDITMLLDTWQSDVDGDGFLDEYQFTRTPLVVNIGLDGSNLQILLMHTKSNFVNNGQALFLDPATRQEYIVAALKNRRRNSAESMRMRMYLDAVLQNNVAARMIVLGDLNDGPGRDFFEENYLTHSVTDTLIGSAFEPENIFSHAQHDVPTVDRFTAVFDDFVTGENQKHLLLDHILLSPGLAGAGGLRMVAGSGAIAHAEYNAQVVNQGLHREDRPSDHKPVSVLLEF
jgi:endonuclease/exonuclease/phosphatase family metal-dependent hydrolase